MLQLRPTFSESWYRVAALRAKLRPSAHISRQFFRGERWYVVRDPAGNQFHRLSDAAYRFIGLLDGTRTVEEAWDICGGQLADDAPTQPEIIQILSHLYSANLIDADVTPDATVLLRRHKQLNKRKMQNRFMNVLFPRIPLWDPDRFLLRWMPAVRHVLSKMGAVVWVIVVLSAVVTVGPHWAELKQGANNAIDPSNWLWLWAVFVGIKAIHELGHAFACRRFGGECHELGIMFLVFIPTPYVDASTAYSFPSRWKRIFVGAAGMIVELFTASILAIVWWNIGNKNSLPAELCYNAMLIASVSTLVFNANPLLRYDGYYILLDFLEIPNLRQKSTEYAMGLVKRHIFGVKATQPLPPHGQRVLLFLYATSSSIYRVFVGFVIILVVAYKIPVLGMLMAIGGVATWAVVPIFKLVKYLMLEPELHRKRGRAIGFCGAVAAIIIVCVGMIRFWVDVDAEGIAEADHHAVLHTRVAGFVSQIEARDGQRLKAGQVILVMRDRELEAQKQALSAQMRSLTAQRQEAMVVDPAQAKIVEAAMTAVQQELDDADRRNDDLTVKAPFDGTLVAPKLSEMAGAFVPRGQEVATVATLDNLIIKAAFNQDDSELVEGNSWHLRNATVDKNSPVQVRFVGDMLTAVPGYATTIISSAQDTVPHPSLMQTGGGGIAPDPTDAKGERPLAKNFEVDVRIANPNGTLYPGQRVYVRLRLEKKPLMWQWTRKFLQMLATHENDSKLV